MAAIPEKSWGILPTSDSSYEKWLNGTRTFDPAVWQEIAEKYKEDRFLEMVIKELNDGVLVTVMDRFGIKVATVNEIDKELFIVAVGNQFHEIAKGSGSADNIVKNIYENTKSKKLFPVYGQKALAEYSKVKTNFSDELCDMEKVFICNTLSTVDSAYSRRGLPARGTVIQDATLDKIAEQSNMVALIANGGMGKTMMLRHLFVESMKKYSETGVMPILVELRDYRFAGCDLFNSIVKSVNLFDVSFNERAAEKVLRAGKCQILLDGLDEIDPSDIRNSEFMCKKTGIEKMNLQIIFGFLIWNNYPVIIWMRFVKSIKTCRFLGECWKSLGEMVINDLNTLRPLAMNRKPLFF